VAVKKEKSRVLFVDDERRLLESVAVLLRREYDIELATSGPEALRRLVDLKDVAVVVSDFRMPQMDGAQFLHEVMLRAPQATRILLTGEAGVEGAKDAVNKGQIFRFLTKPCPTDQLKSALEEGIAQYRLANAERTVLQETLLECVAALMEVLAVTNPVAFGRAQRIKQLAAELANRLQCGHFWQLEAAALLSQIGYFAVSQALAEKIYYGQPLSADEQQRAAEVPAVAMRLLEHIPRLEPVIQILAALNWNDAALARLGNGLIGLGARVLSVALDYDAMNVQGLAKSEILQKLKAREARYGAGVLTACQECFDVAPEPEVEIVAPLREAKPGMRLRQEIRSRSGALLVPIGFEISERLLSRLEQVLPEALHETVRLSPPRPTVPKA
jgi:response regulator RpfG family c-di-GMP phosphodiesterase